MPKYDCNNFFSSSHQRQRVHLRNPGVPDGGGGANIVVVVVADRVAGISDPTSDWENQKGINSLNYYLPLGEARVVRPVLLLFCFDW